MNLLKHPLAPASFFAFAVVFHAVILLTRTGNYFHGGTPTELIALQAVAVVLCVIAIRLFPLVSKLQRIAVVLVSLLPLVFVIGSLWSILHR